MSAGDWKAMFKAVQDGDLALVEYYLGAGIDPNYQHPEFMALPLVEAIRFKELEIAKILLENGALPNHKEDLEGETAWSVAQQRKHEKAIVLLQPYLKA